MTIADEAAPERARYWTVPVVRGVLGLVPAAVVTFSADHTASYGLAVFGVWAVVSGLVVGALAFRLTSGRVIRSLWLVNAVVTVAAGLLAFALAPSLALFLTLTISWAAVTGIVELVAGLRTRGRSASSRDWVAAGALTALLAVALLLLPPDSATAVGFLGGYLVILGVYLLIAGFSLRWSTTARTDAPGSTASGPTAAAGTEPR